MSTFIHTCRPAFWALFVAAGARSFAADPVAPPERDARLDAMRQRAESLNFRLGTDPENHRVKPVPLLRYNDPTNTTTDGTLWLWEVKNRPAAALCLFMDSREGFQWNYELVALSNGPSHVEDRRRWKWNPQKADRGWQTIADLIPAETASQRLTQMKTLAARFDGEEKIDGGANRMRLLPRPVHRYSAPDDGVLDGALFLLVIGTNPEVLVQVETVKSMPSLWRVGFARLSAAELTVREDDHVVWNAPRILHWDPSHEYFSHYGPDRDAEELRLVPGTKKVP